MIRSSAVTMTTDAPCVFVENWTTELAARAGARSVVRRRGSYDI